MSVCYKCIYENFGTGDSFDWETLIIAIATVFVTLFVVILGKKVEIRVNKFNTLCLRPLEQTFDNMLSFIQNNQNQNISAHLNEISLLSTDASLLFVHLRKIYPTMDINELQNLFQEFSDNAFNNSQQTIGSLFPSYVKMRIEVLDKTYSYSLDKETTLRKLQFWKI